MRGSRTQQHQRDRSLEGEYSYRRSPEDHRLTTLAIVSRDRDELAHEFLRQRTKDLFGGEDAAQHNLEADLIAWEGLRFGRQLERVAHGFLLGAVQQAMKGGQGER